MEEMKKKAVLFDFDGTIMDTNDLINRSWRYTFEQISGNVPSDEVIYSTYGEILEDTMRDFFGGTDEDIQKHIEIYRSYHKKHFDEDIHLFPGIKELLSDLKDRGYTVALVTSRLAQTTYKGLDDFGIREMFDALVTADDTDIHKPQPEPALAALRKIGMKPGEAVMLGDTWMDMECARRAGVTPVLAGWSEAYKYSKEKVMGKPEYTVHKPAEFLDLLDKLNGGEN
ncbi:MAG: HAD-IA family hydrolase [Anaerovoracaceae bacterium]|nr:HAD-IA family hydrolase [Bacillota bacterium]MDY2670634.1 HAD-IA family hydrolase [Anaerovoracaceae bacterium]